MWAKSTGGPMGQSVTPETSERSYVLELTSEGEYRETSTAEGTSEGTYAVGTGSSHHEPDKTVSVLQFDRPLFGRYFGPWEEYALRIRGDTLELTETNSHPWVHSYARRAERVSASGHQSWDGRRPHMDALTTRALIGFFASRVE